MTILRFAALDVNECYHIARDEAERYQEQATALAQGPISASSEGKRAILLAKRNAAGRIARLIRFGHFENGNGGNGR